MGIFSFLKKSNNKVQPFKKDKDDNTNNLQLKNPRHKFQEIKSYMKKDVEYHVENGKRINNVTGIVLAKQSSIDRTTNDLQNQLNFKENNFANEVYYTGLEGLPTTIDSYLLGINLPYYFAGILAYKRGDWHLAEKWWLMVLDIRPTNSASKLEIMYRKQKRYQDIADMYSKALENSKNYFHLTGCNLQSELNERYKYCKNDAKKFHKYDLSKGIANYDSLININYINKLQSIAKTSPY